MSVAAPHETIHCHARNGAPCDCGCQTCHAHSEALSKRAAELAEDWASRAIDLLTDHSEPSVQRAAFGFVADEGEARRISDPFEDVRLGDIECDVVFAQLVGHVFNRIFWALAKEAGNAHSCPECDAWTEAGGVCEDCANADGTKLERDLQASLDAVAARKASQRF